MNHLDSWPLFPAFLPPEAAAPLSLQFLIRNWLTASFWLEQREDLQDEPLHIDEFSQRLDGWVSVSLSRPLLHKGGVLDKLCFYTQLLLETSGLEDENQLLLHLEGMRQDARHANSNFSLARKPKLAEGESIFVSFHLLQKKWKEWVKTSQNKLKELFNLLFNFLQEFKHDENLLFLLIEQKDLLNQYLGQRAVETILSRLFPQGACTLREAIYNGYARRGFLDFYARNEELIESVDWKDPCPLSNLKPES